MKWQKEGGDIEPLEYDHCQEVSLLQDVGVGTCIRWPECYKNLVSHKTSAAQNLIFNDHCLPAAYNQEAIQTRCKKIRDNI